MLNKTTILATLEPFVKAKVYNPNNSENIRTSRTINIPAAALINLYKLNQQLINELNEEQNS